MKTLQKIGIETYNDKLLFAFSTVLFLPILFDFITTVTGGNSSTYTIAIYLGTLLFFFAKFSRNIKIVNIGRLFTLYFLFLLNYIVFPVSQPYLSSIEFYLICLYFLPIGLLLITQIKDWDKLTSIANLYSIPAFSIGLYILFFTSLSYGERGDVKFTYMEFSYALLPFICASFASYFQKKDKLSLLVFFIGVFEIISYGCRGAIISVFLFVVAAMILHSKSNKMLFIFSATIGLTIFFNLENIAQSLLSYDLFSNSYFLQHFVNGEMFESQRSTIYDVCIERITNMGAEICGFFGDRPYCGSVYPHNIIYEIMMQFGWILGPIILFAFFYLIISCLRIKRNRLAVSFILCAMLFKYLLSGSYLLSGQFWIALSALISIKASRQNIHSPNTHLKYGVL